MPIQNSDRSRRTQATRDKKEESVRGHVKKRRENKGRRILKSKGI